VGAPGGVGSGRRLGVPGVSACLASRRARRPGVPGVSACQRARRPLDLCSSAGWSANVHHTFGVSCGLAA